MREGQCPWDGFQRGTLEFCEAHLCSWIVAPAETWSNLFYLLVGIWLYMRARPEDAVRKVIGLVGVVIGLLSGLYHASHLWVTETADLGSMGFLSSFLLAHALVRRGWLSRERFWIFYWVLSCTSWIVLLFIDGPPRLWVFAGVVIFYATLEGTLAFRDHRLGRRVGHRSLLLSLGLFLVSYTFWLLDFHRIVCDPDSHYFSGHAAWHVINAFCFLTLSRHLSQFPTPWLEETASHR